MAEYIDREEYCEKHCRCSNEYCDKESCPIWKAPAADVAPVVHGRIVGSLEDGRYRRRFSCCGEDATMITQWAWPNYCPNCGAKMDGGGDT